MHLLTRIEAPESSSLRSVLLREAVKPPPFGPGFHLDDLEDVVTMEVHGSSFSDPGHDFVEFRLLDSEGVVLRLRRVGGY
jgi:hypothetical protein